MALGEVKEVTEEQVNNVFDLENDFIEDVFKNVKFNKLYEKRNWGISIIILSFLSIILMVISLLVSKELQPKITFVAVIFIVFAILLTIQYKHNEKHNDSILIEKDLINSLSVLLTESKYQNYIFIKNMILQMEANIKESEYIDEKGRNMILDLIVPLGASVSSFLLQYYYDPSAGDINKITTSFIIGIVFSALPIFVEGIKACAGKKSLWKKKQVIKLMKKYNLYKIKYNL